MTAATETAWAPSMPELEGATHRRVETPGVTMHVAELGPADAPPLLLVHGWPQSWWCWHRVAPLLAEDHRLVMPDLRGHGWSGEPASGYAKEAIARDLIALLDALEIDRAGYVGHDWGAFCGFLASFAAPERLTSFLCCSIPHLWPSRHDKLNPWRLTSFAYQIPLSTVGRAMMRRRLTTRVLKAASEGDTFDERDIAVYESTMGSDRGGRATVGMYRTFVTRELWPIVRGRYDNARLDVPARLLIGEKDIIGRGADLLGYEANAPSFEVERVAGAGHFLPEERPELVAERARELATA